MLLFQTRSTENRGAKFRKKSSVATEGNSLSGQMKSLWFASDHDCSSARSDNTRPKSLFEEIMRLRDQP